MNNSEKFFTVPSGWAMMSFIHSCVDVLVTGGAYRLMWQMTPLFTPILSNSEQVQSTVVILIQRSLMELLLDSVVPKYLKLSSCALFM